MKKLIEFLKPTKVKLILFGVFLILLYLASVQSWGFCKECGVSKPILYDYMSWFGAWITVVYITLPIVPFFIVGQTINDIILPLNIMYFYVISCFFIHIYQNYKNYFTVKIITIWNILFLLFIVIGIFPAFGGSSNSTNTEAISIVPILGYFVIPFFLAFVFYGFLLTGIYFIVRKKIKPLIEKVVHS